MAQSIPPRAILVVEDEPFIRYDLVDFFEDHGFQVFEAGDAEAAIQMLEANPAIRIVFTDVQMPGSMNGLMLAHYVRKRYPPTILILASGQGVPGDLPERAMFLHKPFDPRRVLREIDRLAAE